ncbi:MAG: tRNA-(ms[2]io[6]A)-hydroxylase [Cyanothece sp. SIO2G6]|nr:tRNA-(ms[2]io[6]A)-hydroxylase [Cyanothece sp. SIO2G6]
MQITLHSRSSTSWLAAVLADFDSFLLDHAANEKKAAGVALNLAAHYPDKPDLVAAMIDLSIEELTHYREVFKLIRDRQLPPQPDQKDPYVNKLRKLVREGSEAYFCDRLLLAGIIEARGLERFTCIAQALSAGPLKSLYESIYRSEARHSSLFLSFAYQYCQTENVEDRLTQLLQQEAAILADLPVRAALH